MIGASAVSRRQVWAAALLVSVACAPVARANCGAENCPLNPQGLEGSGRAWSFDLGYQYIDQDRRWNGSHETSEAEPQGHVTELFTRTKSWTLNARGQVLPGLRLTAMLPYIQREHAHELQHHPGAFLSSYWKYEGLGDASALAQWTALGSVRSGIGALELQGGIKLPTGRTQVPEVTPTGSFFVPGLEAEAPEAPARPGTGSTDFVAGLQLMRHFGVMAPAGRHAALPLVLSVQGRYNGKGTDGYRVGRELHVSLSSSYPLHPVVSVLGQLNATVHGRDEVGETDATPHHTGGTSVFATPGLRFALPGNTALYGYWQARIYEHTNGPQLVAPSHVIVGASFGFGS